MDENENFIFPELEFPEMLLHKEKVNMKPKAERKEEKLMKYKLKNQQINSLKKKIRRQNKNKTKY